MRNETAIVRPNWLARALVSGFLATTAMVIAFVISYWAALQALRIPMSGVGGSRHWTLSPATIADWLTNLTVNPLVDLAKNDVYMAMGGHLMIGLMLALVYAYFAEPRLHGSGWLKGILFSLVPWFLSLVVFFPLAGAGLFGIDLHAGPLPSFGNLVLHLVYGAVLGTTYGPLGDAVVQNVRDDQHRDQLTLALQKTERTAAGGLICGLALGALVGITFVSIQGPSFNFLHLPSGWFILSAVLMGGALGFLLGMFAGFPTSLPAVDPTASKPTEK